MDHDRDRQGRLERVAGDQRHFGQVLVEPVRADGAGLPLQDEVGGRHHGHAAGIGVEGVFAGQQRVGPDAALAARDQLAVAVVLARGVDAGRAGIGDDDADLADLDHGLGDVLDGREQAVDIVGAFDTHRMLPAFPPTGGQELFGILEAVVEGRGGGRIVAHGRRDDLAGAQSGAVVDGDDADGVLRVLDHHGLEAAALLDDVGHLGQQRRLLAVEGEGEGAVPRDDDELGEVQRIGALAQHTALRTLLAAGFEEAAGVLIVGVAGIVGQGLVGGQRRAIAGEDVADAALRDGHQGLDVQPVLERHEEVHAAAQHGGLEAGLAIHGDQAALDRTFQTPELFNDGDTVVADVADRAGHKRQHEDREECDKHKKRRTGQRSERSKDVHWEFPVSAA